MNSVKQNKYFELAQFFANTFSKDTSTKVGAIFVAPNTLQLLSTGYNGIPIGVDDRLSIRNERPEKYKWFEHGERNAIYSAAKHGISTEGSVLYTNALPCADCARGIIQSGISKVYIHKQFNDICDMHQREQWKGHDDVTFTMFNESGVEVHLIDRVLGCKAFFNGKEFEV